jgi:hypothetical protein
MISRIQFLMIIHICAKVSIKQTKKKSPWKRGFFLTPPLESLESLLRVGTAIEMVLATTPLVSPVLLAWIPSVSFSLPSLMVNLRQVAPVIKFGCQVLSVQLLMVLSAYYLIRRKRQFAQ